MGLEEGSGIRREADRERERDQAKTALAGKLGSQFEKAPGSQVGSDPKIALVAKAKGTEAISNQRPQPLSV
jgi:hypothetical protein